MEPVNVDSKILIEIVRTKMPFGKYKGTLIADLPVYYLEWLHNKGFPPGKLGMMLGSVYEIKINGLNSILTLVRKSLAAKVWLFFLSALCANLRELCG